MEDYLGSPRSGGKPAGPPPPPPIGEVKGRWVLKDFEAEDGTNEVRPFRGQVKSRFKDDGSYKVVYEDGDKEDLDWADLWPLLQRAKAEGVTGPSLPAKKRGRPPKQQAQQQQQQQQQQQSPSQPAKKRGRPPKQPQQQQPQQAQQQQQQPAPPQQQQAQQPEQHSEQRQQQQQGPAAPTADAAAAAAASSPDGKGVKRKQADGQEAGSARKSARESKAGTAGRADTSGAGASTAAAAAATGNPPVAAAEAGAAGASSSQAAGAAAAPYGAASKPAFRPTARKTVTGKGWPTAAGAAAGPAVASSSQAASGAAAASSSQAAAAAAASDGSAAKSAVKPKARKTVTGKGWPSAAAEAAAAGAGQGAAATTECAAQRKQKKPRAPREQQQPAPELPLPEKEREYSYAKGARAGEVVLRMQQLLAGGAEIFNKHLIQAEVDEEERVSQRVAELKAAGRKAAAEKRPSKRPDRVAESRTKAEGSHIGGKRVVGYMPGWPVGSRAYCRSELSCINFHRPPVAGIDFVAGDKAGKGVPSFATSVMVSGWYQDDKDDAETIWYTGEGGNDLLHTRQQVADQQLKRGNKALLGNIMLGLPVRVTRKQKSPAYPYGVCYIFDGLYDVIRWRLHKGKNGKNVFQFQLRRRPGQGELVSQRVEWGAISAPRKLVPKNRQGVVDLDISRGQEARPIAAIDDTWLTHGNDHEPQGCVPPCTALEDIVDEKALVGKTMRGVNQERIEQLRAEGYTPSVQYVTSYQYTGKAAEMAKTFKPAELPAQHRASPHEHLRKLNHGKLPYSAHGQLFSVRPVVYECCPDWQCPEGDACPCRLTQRPSKYRVEVFQTGRCGWGVRTLDTIPQFAFVMLYMGEVYEREEHEHLVRTVEEQDTEYTMDMCLRPDINWDGSDKTPEEAADHPPPEFVCCGLRKRNVAAFVNHSCQPNLFVQPVLTSHHDERCCGMALFSAENIAPFTELTLDYGAAYVSGWPGGCKCGAVNCVSKLPAQQPAAREAAAGEQQEQQQEQPEAGGNGSEEDSGGEEEGEEEEGSDAE
ncbi:hypothetical protein COHA_001296 [Chlorella ohadii]|uniref:Uncharacterized protein n=1 Tax=Chlorella ohadii TaxID=2649997 RepID=A0AAD5H5P8_9CHLO|nr:hypothetical protein COHA_001296 [Chlorella ohadii]